MKEYETGMMRAFARAAAKQEGAPSVNDFVDAIFNERQDLKGKPAYIPHQGQSAHTVIIGDEVFKGVKRKNKEGQIDDECALLQKLGDKGLLVPRVTSVGKNSIFFGMTRMPGIMARYALENNMPEEQMRQLAKDVVGFVINMAQATRAEDGTFLMHDDFHDENIMIDSDTKKFSGVIDFRRTKRITRDQWKPIGTVPRFDDMLKEEYAARKNELPVPAPVAMHVPAEPAVQAKAGV